MSDADDVITDWDSPSLDGLPEDEMTDADVAFHLASIAYEIRHDPGYTKKLIARDVERLARKLDSATAALKLGPVKAS